MSGQRKSPWGAGTPQRANDMTTRRACMSIHILPHLEGKNNPPEHAQSLAEPQNAHFPGENGTIDAQDALQRDLQALADHAARRAAYHRGLARKNAANAAALRGFALPARLGSKPNRGPP